MSYDSDIDAVVVEIIKELKTPRYGNKRQTGFVDLDNKKSELAQLVGSCRYIFSEAEFDAKAPDEPHKISRKELVAHFRHNFKMPKVDASFHADLALRTFYGRPRGKPGRTKARRSGGKSVLVAPLYPVYREVRGWWLEHVGPFYPEFVDDGFGRFDKIERHNPAARLLLLVAQDMDYHYTTQTCHHLHERFCKNR